LNNNYNAFIGVATYMYPEFFAANHGPEVRLNALSCSMQLTMADETVSIDCYCRDVKAKNKQHLHVGLPSNAI